MARKQSHKVKLTNHETEKLQKITKKGYHNARVIKRANVLLEAAKNKTDKDIQSLINVSSSTIWRIRKNFSEGGVEKALYDQERSGRKKKLDDKQEAILIATACSKPPEGSVYWTMELLANKIVELKIIESISDETVRRILKKSGYKTMA